MKLLRYLLSHGLLIVLVVALALSYVYRAQLFPENITAQVDHYVNKSIAWIGSFPKEDNLGQAKDDVVVEDGDVAVATDMNTAEPVTNTASVDTPTQESNTVNTDGASNEAATNEVATNEVATSEVVISEEATSEETISEETISEETISEEVITEQQSVDSNAMPVPSSTDQDSVAIASTPSVQENSDSDGSDGSDGAVETDQTAAAASHADLLNNARLAYQNGKPDQATQLYKELSELNPDDPNVFGEMGNVFYSQGKWKQAGVAYFEAANCLLAQGNPEQVPYLYRVIQGLDQESAEKLRLKLGQ